MALLDGQTDIQTEGGGTVGMSFGGGRLFIEGVNGFTELMEIEYPELTTSIPSDEPDNMPRFICPTDYSIDIDLKKGMKRRVLRVILGFNPNAPMRLRQVRRAIQLCRPKEKWRRNRGA